jgi:alpha-1,2-glucosyltransferase
MLYIWPYVLFFSFPTVLPIICQPLIKPPKLSWSVLRNKMPRFWVLGLFIATALVVVHYNTIIHPFTLADNRHYVFYVFKIIRRSWIIKYLAIPIYVFCGWLVLASMQVSDEQQTNSTHKAHEKQIGFTIIWLATSALCLVTAPLVEPRYFIIHWVIWRIHLSSTTTYGSVQRTDANKGKIWSERVWSLAQAPETWLWMETVWFLLINLVTCYVFLNHPFEWAQEPGRKQRFMW